MVQWGDLLSHLVALLGCAFGGCAVRAVAVSLLRLAAAASCALSPLTSRSAIYFGLSGKDAGLSRYAAEWAVELACEFEPVALSPKATG